MVVSHFRHQGHTPTYNYDTGWSLFDLTASTLTSLTITTWPGMEAGLHWHPIIARQQATHESHVCTKAQVHVLPRSGQHQSAQQLPLGARSLNFTWPLTIATLLHCYIYAHRFGGVQLRK
jgi:hypothetical protein